MKSTMPKRRQRRAFGIGRVIAVERRRQRIGREWRRRSSARFAAADPLRRMVEIKSHAVLGSGFPVRRETRQRGGDLARRLLGDTHIQRHHGFGGSLRKEGSHLCGDLRAALGEGRGASRSTKVSRVWPSAMSSRTCAAVSLIVASRRSRSRGLAGAADRPACRSPARRHRALRYPRRPGPSHS